MRNRNQKRLITLAVSLACFAAAFALDKALSLPSYLPAILYGAVWLAAGYDVLWKAAKNIIHGEIFDENFLMSAATIGALAIGEYPEAAAVMIFYQAGEYFQSLAVARSRASIAALMNIRPDKATVLRDGEEIVLSPEEVEIGETLVIRPGERVPLDGEILSGESALDTSALTGESVPSGCRPGDKILSGAVNLQGVLKVRAEKVFYDSTVSRILDLVENAAAKKARAENFITRFARYYTPAVVGLAVLLAVIPPIFLGGWKDWIFRALTFLVISCPCALVISVPLGFFGGIGGASKKGILFKGAAGLELIDKARLIVFDKTGTLTKGVFEVTSVEPAKDKERILSLAAIAERGSLHPIAKSILRAAGTPAEDGYEITELPGKGISADKDSEEILCGNAALMESRGIAYTPATAAGSVVYVAHNGQFVGSITVSDILRDEAPDVVSSLKKQGVRTFMLTGDNEAYAKEIAMKSGVDGYKSGLLPGDKVSELEKLMSTAGGAVAFVGDGINDAPVLMRADAGISMGGIGSDSAIEASDIVLMHDNLNGIADAKKIASKTLRIVRQNIAFALIVKFSVLILGALGYANMWLAVFADVGVSVLAILNAIRTIKPFK